MAHSLEDLSLQNGFEPQDGQDPKGSNGNGLLQGNLGAGMRRADWPLV